MVDGDMVMVMVVSFFSHFIKGDWWSKCVRVWSGWSVTQRCIFRCVHDAVRDSTHALSIRHGSQIYLLHWRCVDDRRYFINCQSQVQVVSSPRY